MTHGTINDAMTLRSDLDSALGRIDQYELLSELGSGGFGTVYLAHDTVAGINVAVKGLPPVFKHNVEELEHIRENFALVSRLHHPYIVAALHLHRVQDVRYRDETVRENLRVLAGDTLMVMEYAPGVTLSKWRKQFPGGKVPFDQAIQLVWQVAQALDYAHEQHIIHRDIKPSNIMIETRANGEMVARLLDFGLAAEIHSSVSRVSREVRDTCGTCLYMAPEQWAGRKQGAATDQYALAVVFCELLTGDIPFRSVFETGDSVVMMTAVCNLDVELPEDCPRKSVLCRALAKEPSQRFASCMEFVEAAAKSEGQVQKVKGVECTAQQKNSTVVERRSVAMPISSFSWSPWSMIAIMSLMIVGGVVWHVNRQHQLENSRRFMRLKADIGFKVSRAKDMMKSINAFRDDLDGLESRIASADDHWKIIAAMGTSDNLEAAQASFVVVDKAEGQITLDYNWLMQNKGRRDAAKMAELEVSALLGGDVLTFEAERFAAKEFKEGKSLLSRGKDAFDKGDFAEAEHLFGKAKAQFASAVRIAKPVCIRASLKTVREYLKAGKWRECIVEVDKVIGWDEGNIDARRLKAKAESLFIPSLNINAAVDGKVADGAKITIDGRECNLPVERKTLEYGECFGPCKVSYESGGKRYHGTFEALTVDWRGPKEVTVDLKEGTSPQHGDTATIVLPGGEVMTMIYLEPGSFLRKSPSDENKPSHRMTLMKGYWLGKYEVTQRQWQSVMRNNPSYFEGDNLPVEQVSWEDCQRFIKQVNVRLKCGARLPTEVEWEYACCAGTFIITRNTDLAFGAGGWENKIELETMGWFGGNSESKTYPVGRKKANAWGFYDMYGNVWEWCSDWVEVNSAHVQRGGGVFDSIASAQCRTRGTDSPSRDLGFRLVCSVIPTNPMEVKELQNQVLKGTSRNESGKVEKTP